MLLNIINIVNNLLQHILRYIGHVTYDLFI